MPITDDVREKLVDVETEDGLVLPGALFAPADGTDTCVVWLHGFGSSHDYRPCVELGRILAKSGIAFLTVATRGQHGAVTGWQRRGEQWGTRKIGSWFEVLTEAPIDIRAWLGMARSLGYSRLVLAGHSFGAAKVAYHLGTQDLAAGDTPIDGLVLASPSHGIAHLDPEVVELATQYVARGDGQSLLPEGSWPRGFGTRTVSAQTMVGWVDVSRLVYGDPGAWQGRVSVPVLAYYGDTADVGAEPELDTFTSLMTASPYVDRRILPGVKHNYDGGAATIADAVISWWHEQENHTQQERIGESR